MRVRQGNSGKVSRAWLLRIVYRGEETRLALGTFPLTSLEAARELAREAREQASRGIDPRRARPRRRVPSTPRSVGAAVAIADAKYAMETVAGRFMDEFVVPHRKCPEYVQRSLDADVLPFFRGRDIRTITPLEIVERLDQIAGRGARTMANRAAAILTQMFRFAIQKRLVTTSPVQLLYPPGGRERPRQRVLEDDELTTLLACLDDVMARAPKTAIAIRLLLLTAARRGELALAKWSDVRLDAETPTWRVPPENAKTGVPYEIQLTEDAVEYFRVLKRMADRSAYVFPAEIGDGPADPKLLTRSMARHRKLLQQRGIKPFVLHDLRRTVRSGLSRLRIPPHISERVLNHAQPGIVATYDVYAYGPEKREALEKWAAHLRQLETAGRTKAADAAAAPRAKRGRPRSTRS
jgi:integrase